MFVIGITGGIGCGKSTAARIIGSWGITVLDADRISHEVTEPGGPAIARVMEAFGPEILDAEGGLNRSAMGQIVFADRKALDQLSMIVHEEVMERMAELRLEAEEAGEKAVVLDVPIPVQDGFRDTCDYIVTIWCDDALRFERLEARGMAREEAQRRMNMQLTEEEYSGLATVTVQNNGTLDELEEALRQTVGEALTIRGIRIPERQKN